jgi:two-component system alkaline phosphatase synthesis response regulator PhoP
MLPGEDACDPQKAPPGRRTAAIPVIMITAKDTEFDTVVGLDAGAERLYRQALRHDGDGGRVRRFCGATAAREGAEAITCGA